MVFGISDHGICNTALALGLISYQEKQENCAHHDLEIKNRKKIPLKYDDHMFPSLSLGLPQESYASHVTKVEADLQTQASSTPSAVSSFSNSSTVIKRERDHFVVHGGEDLEIERLSSRVSDEDEDGNPRKKLRLNKKQSAILEENFKEHSTLNPKQKQALAEKLNLRPRQVEVWFQNRRARTKLKQTEVDCEVLKKCCETLTEENKRLHKELQELKSLKLQAGPLYMQLPAATLTMCPSCEKISTGGTDGSSSTSTITVGVGSKPSFYNPNFTHPSAAC